MRARSTTVRIDPAALDRLSASVRDDVMGAYRDLPGFVGVSLLAERETGRCVVTTAWESEDALRAADEPAEAGRPAALAVPGTEPPRVETWDVAVMHRARETREGCCARVHWASGAPGTMDGALDLWRSTVLPAVERMPGFCSVSVLVDRDGGRAVACYVADSREAMAGNAAAGAALGDRFRAATGLTVDDRATFDVVLAHLRVPELA
jgi:heme-degrading monooxygenase HmoA